MTLEYAWDKTKNVAWKAADVFMVMKHKLVDPSLSSVKQTTQFLWQLQKNPILRQRLKELSRHAYSAAHGLEKYTESDVHVATENVFRISKYCHHQHTSYAPSSEEILDLIGYGMLLDTESKIQTFFTWRNEHYVSSSA